MRVVVRQGFYCSPKYIVFLMDYLHSMILIFDMYGQFEVEMFLIIEQ